MKALKIIGRIILTIFFIVLIAAIVIVCSYTMKQPSRTGDSRTIITGPWGVIKDDDVTLTFDQTGKFSIEDGSTTIADGYFKINEKTNKIKLLMWPNHYTSEFSKYVKFKVLAEISYDQLEFPTTDDGDYDEENPPTGTFLLREVEGSGSTIYECKMREETIDLYASEHDLTKDD